MKKILILIIPLLLAMSLYAVDFDISGENRTRAALFNSITEDDGAFIDNRFNLYLDSQLHRDLCLHAGVQVGDVTWGKGNAGFDTSLEVAIKELYLDYAIRSWDLNIQFGQLYWRDRMGLIIDDYFSGIMLEKTFGENLNTEFAMMKGREGAEDANDDVNYFMIHALMDGDMPWGTYLFFYNDALADDYALTLMPYFGLELENLSVDTNFWADYQEYNDDKIGIGAAVKAKLDLTDFVLGADVLVAAKNGLSVISPWYHNGLYIYGIGEHHDGLNLYWNNPYTLNSDFFASMVGEIKVPFKYDMQFFGHAGYLIDTGMEVNAGLEYELIPDLFNMALYGAFGLNDDETKNYAFGTTLKLEF